MKIYLAGPDVFRPRPLEHFMMLKELCTKHGHQGISPFDNETDFEGTPLSKEHSIKIFQSNVETVKICDVVFANLENFRGACIDDGTAWELGCGFAYQKLLYGYTEYHNVKLKTITEAIHSYEYIEQRHIYPSVESFSDNCVNLMIQESIEISGGKILRKFEDCLVDLNEKYVK